MSLQSADSAPLDDSKLPGIPDQKMLALVNTYIVHTTSLLNDFSLNTESRLLDMRSKYAAASHLGVWCSGCPDSFKTRSPSNRPEAIERTSIFYLKCFGLVVQLLLKTDSTKPSRHHRAENEALYLVVPLHKFAESSKYLTYCTTRRMRTLDAQLQLLEARIDSALANEDRALQLEGPG